MSSNAPPSSPFAVAVWSSERCHRPLPRAMSVIDRGDPANTLGKSWLGANREKSKYRRVLAGSRLPENLKIEVGVVPREDEEILPVERRALPSTGLVL